MSKGSTPRPIDIPKDQFESNWEKTFGKKTKEQPRDKSPKHN